MSGIFQIGAIKIRDLLGITAKGQKTMAESLPVVLASNQSPLSFTFSAGEASIRAVIQTFGENYAAGDVIDGPIDLLESMIGDVGAEIGGDGEAIIINTITLADRAALNKTLHLFFLSDMEQTYTDNTEANITTDAEYIAGVLTVVPADWVTAGTRSFATLRLGNLQMRSRLALTPPNPPLRCLVVAGEAITSPPDAEWLHVTMEVLKA